LKSLNPCFKEEIDLKNFSKTTKKEKEKNIAALFGI
jgi:hypothetical protein